MNQKQIIFKNGMAIRLDLDDERFKGLAEVSYRGTALRGEQLPWTFYTESESFDEAVRFETFCLEEIREEDDTVSLVLKSKGSWLPRAQEADAMGEARVKVRRLKAPEVTFVWRFQAITERLYENDWDGVSMQISFESPDCPIHWILEAATWEIGGQAAGNTLIQQDISTIQLEQEVEEGSEFSTIEKFFTDTKDGWGGNYPMDMLPRAAGASICDFQAKDDTALCLFAERPGLTRARLDKFSDEPCIHYTDRAYFPLTKKGAAPERKLLVHKSDGPLKRHEKRNLWLDCFTEVRRRILDYYDFELETPEPCVGAHLWDKELKERMADWPKPLMQDLPKYAEMGFTQAFVHGVWDSITSDPAPPLEGNICCPYTFRFAEMFGGPDGMKELNDKASENGIRLMQWFSFHLSRVAPIWKEHPDWVLREANGDPWDGNYGELWSGRVRSGYGEWFKQQILDVNRETGIDGIFWDSYQNLGVTCIDWGEDDKAPQADEIFRLQGELQRAGFKQRVEVITIFGVSQVGTFGFENDQFRRRLWSDFVEGDQAFALVDCSPGFFTKENPLGDGKLSPEKYFWMAAHRVVPGLGADPWQLESRRNTRFPGGDQVEAYARVNHLYNRARPQMARLRLQEGGSHVLWLDGEGNPSLIWAFKDCSVKFDGGVRDFESDESLEGAGGEFPLQAGRVYRLAE